MATKAVFVISAEKNNKEASMISGIGSTNSYTNLWQVQQSSSTSQAENIFSKIDKDGDGSVSKSEFSDFQKQMETNFTKSVTTSQYDTAGTTSSTDDIFSKIDTNGDGSVSKDELGDFQKKMQAMGPPPPPPGQGNASVSDTGNSISSMLQQVVSQYMQNGQSSQDTNVFGSLLTTA